MSEHWQITCDAQYCLARFPKEQNKDAPTRPEVAQLQASLAGWQIKPPQSRGLIDPRNADLCPSHRDEKPYVSALLIYPYD